MRDVLTTASSGDQIECLTSTSMGNNQALDVNMIGGNLLSGINYDTFKASYSTTMDTYQYLLDGELVATIEIEYTDDTKCQISCGRRLLP